MSSAVGPGRRVGIVCPYSLDVPGGVQNHVIGLAGHLTRAGHDVSVLAPGRPDPATLARHGLVPDQVVTAGGAVPLRYNGSVARVSFGPVPSARVRRWLDTGQFDLVHLHEPITPSVAWHALVAAQAPVVATFHTANPSSRSMRLAGRVRSDLVDKIGVRIAVSATAAQMVATHLDHDSQIIPNGFDHAEFADGPLRTTRRGGPPRLVFLGRLTETRKGLDVLLEALPAILAVHPGLEVLVAGQGRRRLPAPCQALGQVSDADRARLLADADVFVAPHVARESFGLVLIEALAAGAPVVASDLAAFVDVLDPADPAGARMGDHLREACGRLFPVADARSLAAQVLATLATAPTDLAEQRRRGRELTRRFDWTEVGPQVEQAYARALGAASHRAAVDTPDPVLMSARTRRAA